MTEKKLKKLGEVLAFARVGTDTFNKGKEGLVKAWGEEKVNELIKSTESHTESIEKVINGIDGSETGLIKAEATGEKLSTMRDLYIKDEWDDPIEMFEWLGFFQGAAIVHWSLIEGFGEKEEDNQIKELANEIKPFHQKLFEEVDNSIKESIK
ncbi:MAG: hypothetical protein WDZ80_06485 [Candidatus Paceibacterota bacterium]